MMNYFTFLRTLPDLIRPQLPPVLQPFTVRQPSRWLMQMHYGESWLHYEVGRVVRSHDMELALHFESKDSKLNRLLLLGMRRHLFEIRDLLGEQIEAEVWDRGWSKLYERFPEGEIGEAYQTAVATRMATIMNHLHPIFVDVRRQLP